MPKTGSTCRSHIAAVGPQAAVAGEGEGTLAHSSIAAACALAVVPVRIAPTDPGDHGFLRGGSGTAMVAHGGYR